MNIARQNLLSEVEMMRASRGGGSAPYLYEFMASHGRVFRPAPRPRGVREGAPKQCYRNAALLALTGRAQYVEGFIAFERVPLLNIAHAWCVANGKVIDPTIDAMKHDYFGVVIPRRLLRTEVMRSEEYGLLTGAEMFNRELAEALGWKPTDADIGANHGSALLRRNHCL